MTDQTTSKSPALKALLSYRQADEEGVMVLASRQAIHEVADALADQAAEIERLREAVKRHARQHPTGEMGEDFKRRNLEAMWDESIELARTALTHGDKNG